MRNIIVLVIWVVIAVGIYNDANKRGNKNAILWGIVGFLLGLIGLLIYYLVVVRADNKKKAPEA